MTATVETGSIKNISGRDLEVPGLGGRLVFAGQAVDCPLDLVTGYTQQERTWAPYDEAAQTVHDEMLEAIAYLIALAAEPEPEVEKELTAPELVKLIADLDAETLAALVAAENDRPTPRKTVLEAAEKRAEKLKEI